MKEKEEKEGERTYPLHFAIKVEIFNKVGLVPSDKADSCD